MSKTKKYTVVDRAEGRAPSLTNFSAVNPRYLVWDNENSRVVDEYTSVVAARMLARDLNAGLYE